MIAIISRREGEASLPLWTPNPRILSLAWSVACIKARVFTTKWLCSLLCHLRSITQQAAILLYEWNIWNNTKQNTKSEIKQRIDIRSEWTFWPVYTTWSPWAARGTPVRRPSRSRRPGRGPAGGTASGGAAGRGWPGGTQRQRPRNSGKISTSRISWH